VAISSLPKKLQLKPNQIALILNAPTGYLETLTPLPEDVVIHAAVTNTDTNANSIDRTDNPTFDFVQAFVRNKAELEAVLPNVLKVSSSTSLIWLAYPKGGQKAGTDLNRDILWEAVSKHGLIGVSLIALDEVWSALRFRPAESVK
jgi:hypothetical protein